MDEPDALKAVKAAIYRVFVRTADGLYRISDLIERPTLDADQLAALKRAAEPIVESSWFQGLKTKDKQLYRLEELFNLAGQIL